MRNSKGFIIFMITVSLFFLSCTNTGKMGAASAYSPVSKELYDTIVTMDSLLFAAYNNCDLVKFASLVSEDIEFFHDQGGLMTSKKDIVDALKKNICGKVTRELVKGSIEVYPIANYGAVEMGSHFFYNNREKPGTPSKIGKFVQLWKKENGQWQLTRVISLH